MLNTSFFILYFLASASILLWYFLSYLNMILKGFTGILHCPEFWGSLCFTTPSYQTILMNAISQKRVIYCKQSVQKRNLKVDWSVHYIGAFLSKRTYYHETERKLVWEYGNWKHTCKMQMCNPAWDVMKMNADVNLKSSRQDFMVIVNN